MKAELRTRVDFESKFTQPMDPLARQRKDKGTHGLVPPGELYLCVCDWLTKKELFPLMSGNFTVSFCW